MNIVEMRNINKSFPGVKALSNISFSVKPGTPIPPSLMNIYQELHEYLEKADYSLFEINPNESLEFLGLFTRDIVNKFSQEIETPSFLEKFI